MVKKRGILLRIITGTVMLILVIVSALVQTEPAAAAGSRAGSVRSSWPPPHALRPALLPAPAAMHGR